MHALRTLWRDTPHTVALGIIVLTTTVRLLVIASNQLDLAQDEAQYWLWSRRLDFSYYSKGPLVAWIIAACTSVFGDTGFGVRFGAVFGSLCSQLVLYLGLGRLMARPRLAVLALCILNSTPLFLACGILMTTDNPLLVCWLATLFCLHAAAVRPGALWPLACMGLCMAFGILAKYIMVSMVGIAALHALGLYRCGALPHRHCVRVAAALGTGTLAGLLPIVVWNMQNGWASFRHVGRLAGVIPAGGEAGPFVQLKYVPEFVGGQLGLVFPWWLAFMVYGGILALRSGWWLPRQAGPFRTCDAAPGPERLRDAREAVLFSAGFWPLFLFFLAWSFHTRIYANWPAMCYAAGVVLAARGLDAILEKYRNRPAGGMPLTRRLVPLWVGLSLVLYLAAHVQEPLSRFVPSRYNPVARLKGWSDLGRHIGEIRAAMPNPDRVFFFSDQYDVASELAFYIPGKPTTYCADFGRRFNQFDFWPGPEGMEGWDAIYVRRSPFATAPPLLHTMFATLETPQPYASIHRSAPGRRFGVMVVRGFNGVWPRINKDAY